MQERHNFIAIALELSLSSTNPSKWKLQASFQTHNKLFGLCFPWFQEYRSIVRNQVTLERSMKWYNVTNLYTTNLDHTWRELLVAWVEQSSQCMTNIYSWQFETLHHFIICPKESNFLIIYIINDLIKVKRNTTLIYCQTSNISRTSGNKIIDHSDVVGASPISTAPTTSSFSN